MKRGIWVTRYNAINPADIYFRGHYTDKMLLLGESPRMQGAVDHICGSCGGCTSVSRCIRAMQTMRNAACGATQGRTRHANYPAERTFLISLLR